MAITFIEQLNRLLANNKPDKALEEIFEALRIYKRENPDKQSEIEDLESQLIMLSARMKDLDNKQRNIQMSNSEIEVSRSRMFSSLIGVIKGLGEYPTFGTFLNQKEVASEKEEPHYSAAQPPHQAAFSSQPQSFQAPTPQTEPQKQRSPLIWVLVIVLILAAGSVAYYVLEVQGNNGATTPSVNPATQEFSRLTTYDSAKDEASWKRAKASNTKLAYELYLITYEEEGKYAKEAEEQLKKLDVELEEKMWDRTKQANTREAYQKYLEESHRLLYIDEAKEQIEALMEAEELSEKVRELVRIEDSDTLTLDQKANMLSQALPEIPAASRADVQKKIDEYKRLLEEHASITSSKNFVVARTVQDLNPLGIGSQFSQSRVHAWARVKAPKSEALSFVWYDINGKTLHISPASVQKSDSYRTYKSHKFEQSGQYEVRLYNSQNRLIAREVFTVKL